MQDQPDWTQLSESQRICLRLVARGLTSKEIAREAQLSPLTVDQYLSKAASSLGCSNRRQAAQLLLAHESGQFSKAELNSATVAGPEKSSIIEASDAKGDADAGGWKAPRWIPPLGGERHDLTKTQTIKEIVKASLLAAGGFGAIVATGAWLQSLFT